MSDIEELRAKEARVRAVLDSGVEAELRAIPGVVHVSIGLKQINGTATDEFSIRVYVAEKKAADAIPPSERIPRRIQGIPTDVNEVKVIRPHVDTARYRPLLGGIQITNGVPLPSGGITFGTLGCLATDAIDNRPLIVTNFHVIGGNTADTVFQPEDFPSTNQIATVKRGLLDGVIDASVAEVIAGTPTTTDEINLLAIGGSNHVSGVAFPIAGMRVFKVGITTGRTEGKVVDPNASVVINYEPPIGAVPMEKQMLVQCTRVSTCCCCSCTVVDDSRPFSDHGDSGSAIVDERRRVVGLVVGGNGQESYGCRMFEVLSRLRITVNATPVAPSALVAPAPDEPVPNETAPHEIGPFAARAAAAAAAPSADDRSLWADLQRRLDESPFGHEIAVQVRHHLPEGIDLVNRHRAVMVAWQRAKGPAFLAQWMHGVRNPSHAIPREIDGVTMQSALLRMAEVLKTYGSPELRRAIDRYGLDLMALLDRSATVDELLEHVARPALV